MKTKRTVKQSLVPQLIIALALFFAPLAGFASEGDSLNKNSKLISENTSFNSTCSADAIENSEMEITLESWMFDVDNYLNDEEEAEIKLESWMTDLSDPFWAAVDDEGTPELAFETWMANPKNW